MRIITEVKEKLYNKGLSLKYIAEELEKRLNKPYSLANLSNKLRNETITYKEMKLIAEIINCNLELIDKNRT
ncbi:MAG: LLM class flavin-dependent oxidoreductase [Candidatus Gastranaerophilaceae bacterium]